VCDRSRIDGRSVSPFERGGHSLYRERGKETGRVCQRLTRDRAGDSEYVAGLGSRLFLKTFFITRRGRED